MGEVSREVSRCDLKLGDHIYSRRRKALSIYTHHGIYFGDEKVIHFTSDSSWFKGSSSGRKGCDFRECGQGNSGVICSCLDCFLQEGSLKLYMYGVDKETHIDRQKHGSGSCTVAQSNAPDKVIHYAKFLLENEFGKYHLLGNNCEDFALYCKTGLMVTKKKGHFSGASTQISAIRGFFLNHERRFEKDIGVRPDKEKVPVEDILEWFKAREMQC